MRRSVVLLVAALFVLGLFGTISPERAYAKEYKIGCIDLVKTVDEYKKTKELEKTLEAKMKAKEEERKKSVDEIKKLQDEQALLSEKAKAEKQAVIESKKKNLQDFDRNTRDELVKDRNDAFGNILKDIEKVVTDYAKAEGYDLVLNKSIVLYGGDQCDLTYEMLTRLNK